MRWRAVYRGFGVLGAAILLGGLGGVLAPRTPASELMDTLWTTAAVVDLAPWLSDGGERLSPAQRLPRSHTLDPQTRRFLLAACTELPPLGGDSAKDKLARFRRAECNGSPLPDTFFTIGPYMHPMGDSYAARAEHPVGRHIEESIGDTPIHSLSAATRTQLVAGHSSVLGERWVLRQFGSEWRALPRPDLDLHLARRGWSIVGDQVVSRPRSWVDGTLAVGGVFVVFGLGGLVVGSAHERRRTREERAFVVQTLTHELRTPATAVGLAIAALRPHFDALPPDAQDAFLDLTRSNQRLRHTLEATGTLLQMMRDGHPVKQEVFSMDDLLRDLEQPERPGVEITSDPDLLTLILGNVLGNAYTHGAEPVSVHVTHEGQATRVTVEDAGSFATDLQEVTRPFTKGPDSTGLGLGLTLVDEAVTALGGRWSITLQPTRFTLHLPDPRP